MMAEQFSQDFKPGKGRWWKSWVAGAQSLVKFDGDGAKDAIPSYTKVLAHLKTAEIEHARTIFRSIDKDNSGLLDAEEIHKALTSLNVNVKLEDAEIMVNMADADGNGELDVRPCLFCARFHLHVVETYVCSPFS